MIVSHLKIPCISVNIASILSLILLICRLLLSLRYLKHLINISVHLLIMRPIRHITESTKIFNSEVEKTIEVCLNELYLLCSLAPQNVEQEQEGIRDRYFFSFQMI